MSTSATSPTISKCNDNPYTKSRVDKYYRRGEPEHRYNERPNRRLINMADYEEEDDVLIETKSEDSDFVEEYGEPIACVVQKVLCNQKIPTPHN